MSKKKITNAKAKSKQKQRQQSKQQQQQQHAKAPAKSSALDSQPNRNFEPDPRTYSSCFNADVIVVKPPTTQGESREFEKYYSDIQVMGQFPTRNSQPDPISTVNINQDSGSTAKEYIMSETKTTELGFSVKLLITDESDGGNASKKFACSPTSKGITCHRVIFDDDLSSNPSVFSRNGSRSSSGTSTFSNSTGSGPVQEPSDSYSPKSLPMTNGNGDTKPEKEQERGYALYLQRQELPHSKEQILRIQRENQNVSDKNPVPSSEIVVVNGFTFNSWSEAVDDLNDQLDMFVESSSRFEMEKNAAGMTVKLLNIELAKSRESVKRLENKVKSVETQRVSQEKRLRGLKGELEKSAGRISLVESLEGKLVTSESHKASLEHKLKAAIAESAIFHEQAKGSEEKWEKVTAELTKAEDLVVELQREVRLIEIERKSLEAQLQEATTARILPIGDLLPGVRTKNPENLNEIANLKQQIQKLERKFGNREQENKILEEEIEIADVQQRAMRQVLDGQNEQIKLLENELQTIKILRVNRKQGGKNEPESYQDQKTMLLEDEVLAVRGQIEDLKRACGTRDGTIELLEVQRQSIESHCAKLQQKCQGLIVEVELLQAHKNQFSSLMKNQEQQWAKNARLRHQLEKLDGERERQDLELRFLKGDIEDAKLHYADLESHFANMIVSNTTLRNEKHPNSQAGEADSFPLSTLQPASGQLQQVHQDPCNQLQSCEDVTEYMQSKLSSISGKGQYLSAKSTTVKQDQFKAAIHQTALIQELQNKVSKWKLERDLNEPFLKCAVDVRLGFLEYARTVTNKKGVELDHESREVRINAKIASHYANGQLDTAILTSGIVPAGCLETSRLMFEELYSIPPAQYRNWGPKSARLVDCQATLKAIPPSDSLGLSHADTKEYYKTVQDLIILRAEIGDGEFEESEEAEWLVQRLEYLTGMIAAMRV